VLDKYHRGEPSQTVNPDKDQGKISDLGGFLRRTINR
jgi:hypothetical protein